MWQNIAKAQGISCLEVDDKLNIMTSDETMLQWLGLSGQDLTGQPRAD